MITDLLTPSSLRQPKSTNTKQSNIEKRNRSIKINDQNHKHSSMAPGNLVTDNNHLPISPTISANTMASYLSSLLHPHHQHYIHSLPTHSDVYSEQYAQINKLSPTINPLLNNHQKFMDKSTNFDINTSTFFEQIYAKHFPNLPDKLKVYYNNKSTSNDNESMMMMMMSNTILKNFYIATSIDIQRSTTFGPYTAKIGKSRQHLSNADQCFKVSVSIEQVQKKFIHK